VVQQQMMLQVQRTNSSSSCSNKCRDRTELLLAWAAHSLMAWRRWPAQQQQQQQQWQLQQCLVLLVLIGVQMQAAASRLHGNAAR
jgi:hypothetical protein